VGKKESVLLKIRNWKCRHNKFLIDPQLGYVECGICGEKLNPMWVLEQLCSEEARYYKHLEALTELAKKAEKKNRCKCEHCKKMTKIQKRL